MSAISEAKSMWNDSRRIRTQAYKAVRLYVLTAAGRFHLLPKGKCFGVIMVEKV